MGEAVSQEIRDRTELLTSELATRAFEALVRELDAAAVPTPPPPLAPQRVCVAGVDGVLECGVEAPGAPTADPEERIPED